MKKKIIFAVATSFFAVATVFNMDLLQANSASDVSLESIMIMQKAEAETRYITCSSPFWNTCFSGMTPDGYRTWDGTKSSDHY